MAKRRRKARAKSSGGANTVGSLAFIIALIIAVILGALENINIAIAGLLVILGLVIGLLNVTRKESREFMIAGAVLVIVSALGSGEMSIIPAVNGIFDGLMLVFVPATAVVALKEMLGLARS
ncbi:MAG: hypothetical protein MI923_09490 [Phycisphaerales bacterium]|nr:hypothetical protein [Phycisphaerales bacterium]